LQQFAGFFSILECLLAISKQVKFLDFKIVRPALQFAKVFDPGVENATVTTIITNVLQASTRLVVHSLIAKQ